MVKVYEIIDRKVIDDTWDGSTLEEIAGELMRREEEVACIAYRPVLSRRLDFDAEARDYWEDQARKDRETHQKTNDKLTDLYIYLGLAAGHHQAAEFIRDIEAQDAVVNVRIRGNSRFWLDFHVPGPQIY